MSRTALSPADLADAANLISASQAELVFAPDLTIVACSKEYGQAQNVASRALIGLSVREAFRDGPALDRLIGSLETVIRSRRPHQFVANAPGAGRERTG